MTRINKNTKDWVNAIMTLSGGVYTTYDIVLALKDTHKLQSKPDRAIKYLVSQGILVRNGRRGYAATIEKVK